MHDDPRTIDELIEIAESITPPTDLAGGLDAIRGTARGQGVAVEVDVQGMLVDLHIDDQALALGPDRLAAEITRLAGEAGRDSLQQGVVAIQAGCGPDVAAAMVEFLNSVEEEPEPEPARPAEPSWEDEEVTGVSMERRGW
ncbi:hypothetical protein [Saccharopolyspora hordei]|uniref:YbaB/EbfC family DNA-binding protein n=1 Tax=Saccharopolyspora hordei TaxID=1838 RepID=A0A853AL45_9PSEU|nr:hypothetical protein [Saccharopolyspora hordei]NYI84795.1 hypothetical protein [Saccharopolyspora hordei]